jgi:hypothetical protein
VKAPKSQQTLVLEALWKKAHRRTEAEGPLVLTFATSAAAIRARMALYNAVRKAKQGLETDFELQEAAQNLEISWIDKTSFQMRRIDQSEFMQGLESALGQKMGEVLDPAAAESLEKLQRQPRADTFPQFGPRVDALEVFKKGPKE